MKNVIYVLYFLTIFNCLSASSLELNHLCRIRTCKEKFEAADASNVLLEKGICAKIAGNKKISVLQAFVAAELLQIARVEDNQGRMFAESKLYTERARIAFYRDVALRGFEFAGGVAGLSAGACISASVSCIATDATVNLLTGSSDSGINTAGAAIGGLVVMHMIEDSCERIGEGIGRFVGDRVGGIAEKVIVVSDVPDLLLHPRKKSVAAAVNLGLTVVEQATNGNCTLM